MCAEFTMRQIESRQRRQPNNMNGIYLQRRHYSLNAVHTGWPTVLLFHEAYRKNNYSKLNVRDVTQLTYKKLDSLPNMMIHEKLYWSRNMVSNRYTSYFVSAKFPKPNTWSNINLHNYCSNRFIHFVNKFRQTLFITLDYALWYRLKRMK